MHICPMVTVLVPHVGGPIAGPCAPTVLTGMMPQARITDLCVCVGPPDVIIPPCAPTVLVSGLPAARIGDMTAHGGAIILGCFTVLIGSAGAGGPGARGGIPDPVVPPFDLVRQSPTLATQLQQLLNDGWTIQYGPAGGGSTCDRDRKVITIDANDRNNPEALTQTLAHEFGHATYTGGTDVSSRGAYLDSALADEGAATMNNVRVQREIQGNGGPDIGIAGNPANGAQYNRIMDRYERDGDAATARRDIGRVFGRGERTSNTGETYEDYYGGWYDRTYGTGP